MISRVGRTGLLGAAAAVLTVAACGGGDGGSGANEQDPAVSSTAPVNTEAPDDTEPQAAGGIETVQPAVIQIEALGTIRDPEVGFTDGSGRGSGFIISEDGIAVTNNHVVTGAATLEIFIGGDTSDSYNATVLGVSECYDLAVIKIDLDQPTPALSWFDGDITTGMDVYAAGFPLGETEYTLTRGIVSKLAAAGETSWSSIDSVLEHDANIQPGNSGGPLVAQDGSVVGVNYRGRDITGTTQFFAIGRDEAVKAVERLQGGDFESLGINGEAVVDRESDIAGIWVAGVAPGSPADIVGLLPGDIIQTMNGLPVGTDGTLTRYCDVIRTAGDKPIRIEVLRFDTSEILSGSVNGDQPLQQTFSFAQAVEDEVDQPVAAGESFSGYRTIVDDTNSITIDVPNEWTDLDTEPGSLEDGSQVPWIMASPDIDGYNSYYDVPGIIYAVIMNPVEDDLTALAGFAPTDASCVDLGQTEYSDSVFTGYYQVWESCAGAEALTVILVASPISGGNYQAILAAQIVTEADLEALDTAFGTFNVL